MTSTTIQELLKDPGYIALKKLRPDLDLIGFLDDSVAANAWVKVVGFLFDSRASHNLEQAPVRAWLKNLQPRAYYDIAGVIENLPKIEDAETRTYLDWQAPGARKIDILLEFADADNESQVVIGIQNKLGTGDDDDSFSDCQEVLKDAFPNIPVFLVALQNYWRGNHQPEYRQLIPFMHASVDTVGRACTELAQNAEGQTKLLLQGLRSHIDSKLLRINHMDQQAQQFVRELYEKREHREALKHIAQHLPTLRKVSESLLERLKQSFTDHPHLSAHSGPLMISYFPPYSISPKEIKIEFAEVNARTEPHRL
ncbi:MAG TPA: hypothetical protein VEJ63_22010, partial [Planctomycetota bacterium]|nr:hypothetical protein [Planctomycetota bacterium]